MARRVHNVTALIAILLGTGLMAPSAQAATATRSSSFVYDTASGLLTKEIIEPGNSNLCLVTEYEYDGFGNKKKVTTRNCNAGEGAGAPVAGSDAVIAPRTTSSTYDARGQFAETTTNALGHTETRTFDPKFGGVTSLIGPNGLETKWEYDSFGRKIKETRADNTYTLWLYKSPCDLASADLAYDSYCVGSYNFGEGRYKRTYYDNLNRKLTTIHIDFTNTQWIDDGRVDYDAWGRVSKSYLPYVLGSSATAKYATLEYDILGRVIRETAPDGSVTTKTYAGLTSTVTNAKGYVTTTLKNTQGQTVTVTNAQSRTIGYAYDPFGNLTQTTDHLGNVTTLKYDIRGRKTEMNDPDMGTWTYAYNALGELKRQIDAKGQVVTMAYDLLGRMTSRSEPDLVSTWEYDGPKDANGNLIPGGHGVGKLYEATSGNGYSRSHTYDALGRLSSTSTVIDDPAKPYVTKTNYDGYGRVYTQTYPASPEHPTGFAVQNIYNGVGYLSKVVNGVAVNGAAVGSITYWQADTMDVMGHLTQQTYGNGLVTQQIYNPATGRLERQLAGAGSTVQNMSYQYDSLGNLSTRTDVNGNNLQEIFTYDALNRLKTAQSSGGGVTVNHTYAYDAIGNIVCKSDISACSGAAPNYTYNATVADANVPGGIRRLPHAVSGITGTVNGIVNPTYQYDANGNMFNPGFAYDTSGNIVSGTGRNVVWNSFNMPDRIDNCVGADCKTTKFWYNGEHERTIENQADGSIVVTLSPRYDTGLHFEKRYLAANGQLTGAVEYEHYLYAGGQMFGKYVTVTQTDGVTLASAKTTYYSKDHLGSIVAITDEAGAVIQRLSYDVWGKRRYPNGVADPNGLLNNPDMYHGYTGHEMLDDVGLIHMNGRLYDPLTGRFMSADSHIQDPLNLQSYNRYTYVWNNPLGATDPSGYLSLFGHKILPGVFNNRNAKLAVAIGIGIYTGGLVANSAWATCTLSGATWGGIAAGAAGGAVTGGMLAAMNGGDVISGAFYGGISGAIGGGIGSYYGRSWSLSRVAANSIGSGISSVMQGGKFIDGVQLGFAVSGATYLAISMKTAMLEQSARSPGNLNEYRDLGGGRIDKETLDALVKENGGDIQAAIKNYFKLPGSPLGGHQGSLDHSIRIFGIELHYGRGSFMHKVVEQYAGPHDAFNSPIWYDNNGYAVSYHNPVVNALAEGVNFANVLLVTPIVATSAIPEYAYGALNMKRR